MGLTSLEMCAGAGGQALGLERAGFSHEGLIEIDKHACATLRLNRPKWQVFEEDLEEFDGRPFKGIDLLAGGLPCPPFSVAGKQLGKKDERNLFPAAIRLVDEIRPRAVMIENVRGILGAVFEDYRDFIASQFEKLGYTAAWQLLNAADFGVSQVRPRAVFVAIKKERADGFHWPALHKKKPLTVGACLFDLMSEKQWRGAKAWRNKACEIAPAIVGGSKKHGGPDLGPTRAKQAWAELGVNGHLVAEEPPERDFDGMPILTVRMVARLQGFPDNWKISGVRTQAYRQVGNAFPPPVAHAVAKEIATCLATRRLAKVS
ncbi:MAG: DNA cytosine methyltransferase [Nitrospiraceae bacterium]|nr:DNA cytosine methyltransferase [Nitrospiraceae bacterium]